MNEQDGLTLRNFVESKVFDRVIIILILMNSVALGLETFSLSHSYILETFNVICTFIFTIEIILKIIVYKKDVFKNGWILFDIVVVGLSVVLELIFFSGARAVQALRSFRVLRTIRLVPRAKELRNITRSIMLALPGIGWTVCLLFIVYYIYAVVGTNLYASISPDYFGDLLKTLYTLFQLTLADDLGNITRPILEHSKLSAVYFVSFAIVAVLIVLNMIIGIIVDSVEETRKESKKENEGEQDLNIVIEQLEMQLQELKNILNNKKE